MKVEHVTCIGNAILILDSGVFISSSNNPRHGDSGMNCLNGSNVNNYENRGVILCFDWSGPIKSDPESTGRPYPINTLIDNGPWRKVVSLGTDRFLSFDSIKFHGNAVLDKYVSDTTPWFLRIPFTSWKVRKKKLIVEKFRCN